MEILEKIDRILDESKEPAWRGHLTKKLGLTTIYFDKTGNIKVEHFGNMGARIIDVEKNVDKMLGKGWFKKLQANKVKEIGSPDYSYELYSFIKHSSPKANESRIDELDWFETNLAKKNSTYIVKSPFDIWIKTGSKPSNAYYGSAQIYEPIHKKIKANKGDVIFNYFGGLFIGVQKEKKAYHCQITEPESFSPFTKKYSPDSHKWPLEKMTQVPNDNKNWNLFRKVD